MYDLYKILRRVLEGDEGVFMIVKTTEWQTGVKQFKSFRFSRAKGNFTRVETKSSLGLDFW